MKTASMKSITALFPVLAVSLLGLADGSFAGGAPSVDCDAGDSLQAKIDSAKPGWVITVSGTCNERITIRTDNLTLDGGGTAVIDGDSPAPVPGTGTLFRVWAKNVVIKGFTIQDGAENGLNVSRSGSAILEGNTIQGHGRSGVLINASSYARIGEADDPLPHATPGSRGNTITDNDTHGINVTNNGSADVFHNVISSNENSGIALSAGGAARIDSNEITNNVRAGIRLRGASTVRLDTARSHGGTGERNLIQGNQRAVDCRTNSALEGEGPNEGTGNSLLNRNQDGTCAEQVNNFSF